MSDITSLMIFIYFESVSKLLLNFQNPFPLFCVSIRSKVSITRLWSELFPGSIEHFVIWNSREIDTSQKSSRD